MAATKDRDLFRFVDIFSKNLPGTPVLIFLLLSLSIIVGVSTVALMHYDLIAHDFQYIVINGALTGIFIIMMPALMTTVVIKAVKRMMALKHIIFILIISCLSYSVFILLGSLTYIVTKNTSLASAVIIVGDASIFGWWFFISKFVLDQKRRAAIVALTQPTLNILLYIPFSALAFTFNTPLNILLIKLYAGVAIFMVMSYLIIYMFERPVKKSLGISSVDTFSQMIQNWLFDINITIPIKGMNPSSKSNRVDVDTHTIVIKRKDGSIKSIFFLPEIHFGPTGCVGSSNFPYMLERYSSARYKANTVIMHGAVNEDLNCISSGQFAQVRAALDKGVKEAMPISGAIRYSESSEGSSRIKLLSFGDVGLVTLTRAPRVTEDVAPEVAAVMKKLLNRSIKRPVIIDAHNSRYEAAGEGELEGVKLNSKYMDEYVGAINRLKPGSKSYRSVKLGSSSVELFHRLGRPTDLGPGPMLITLFRFNGQKRGMVYINANNMLPSFREAIVRHVKSKYKFEVEVYTTDTHVVNTLNMTASNVLGRATKIDALIGIVDEGMTKAIFEIEDVSISYSYGQMKKFAVWGPNSRERITAVMDSVISVARFAVPIIIVAGFLIAGWIVTLI
jgi:predicted neutral ceramidase superfamily lipid hydrolase